MITPAEPRPAAPSQFCAGKIHADQRRPAMLDPLARAGPSRVGLVEDGAMFCTSCAAEFNRGAGEAQ